MEKLLILGGSCWATRKIIDYAKKEGIYTIVTDYLEPSKSIGKQFCDEHWMISTGDIELLEEKCKENNITSICCGGSEFNIDVMLDLCERLSLKTYMTKEAWHYSRDKQDFKEICRKSDVLVPKDYFIEDEELFKSADNITYPVVVKPVDKCGNTGVSYCYDKYDLLKAINLVREVSDNKKIIIEKMIVGEEWYSSYAIANGEISLMSLNAMYSQPGEPKNCYSITATVSNHVKQFVNEVNPKIENMLKKIGCTDGYAWVQLMLDKDGRFYVIEMGYRMDGEMMFIPYKELTGFDTIKWLVDTARGIEHNKFELPVPQTKAFSKCACGMMLWTNKEGIVTRIVGFDELEKDERFYIEKRCLIGENKEKYDIVGAITFCANDCEEMCDLIGLINSTVHVYNENNEDMIIKYNDFDYMKKIYKEGLNEK